MVIDRTSYKLHLTASDGCSQARLLIRRGWALSPEQLQHRGLVQGQRARRFAIIGRQVRIGAMLQQRLCHGGIAVHGRGVQGCPTAVLLGINRSSMLQQQGYNRGALGGCRTVQRVHATRILSGRIHVCAAGDEFARRVLVGDRFGDALRLAAEVRPALPQALVLSNHHWKYGADADKPGTYFGRTPSFSSRWRYEAGMHKLEAWDRSGRSIGTLEMRELLQTVAHGTTEYSIITRLNVMEFDVALASLQAELWDAPYRTWTRFAFEEVFASAEDAEGH